MKKILFLALILTFIIAGTNYAFAATQEENDENIIKIKKIFDISDDFENFNISSSTDIYGFKTVSYSWSKNNEYINVMTDSEGNIIDYFRNSETEEKINLKSKEEIKKQGEIYLKKIDPELLHKYKLQDLNINIFSASASLLYNRIVNGIEVKNDTIYMTLHLGSKSLSNYSRTYSSSYYTDEKFPSKNKIISKDEAMKIILKENPFYLTYFLKYTDSDNISYVPAYTQLKKSPELDAVSSEFIYEPIYNTYMEAAGAGDNAAPKEASSGLTPTEQKEVDRVKGVKSLEEAKKFAQNNFDLKDMKLESSYLNKYDKNIYVYDLYYSSDEGGYTYLQLGARDFKLYSYSSYDYSSYADSVAKSSALKDSQAVKIAKAFIQKFNKDKDLDLENPVIVKSNEENGETTVNFFVKKNGYYVFSKGVTTHINNENKKLSYYNLSDPDVKLSEMDKDVIGIQKAESIAKNNLKLYYAYVGDKPRLIYSFELNKPVIRAKDGELLNMNGDVDTKGEIVYENINKSKYKDELNLLKSLNIGLPKTLKVDEPITVGDYVYLLNSLSDSYIEYDQRNLKDYISYWMYEDIDVDNLSPNLTRKDAVKWMMNIKDFRKLKEIKNIFDKEAFTDSNKIPKDYRAYYYLAKGLSIYDFDEAAPDKDVTVEEAMHIIYNSIFK